MTIMQLYEMREVFAGMKNTVPSAAEARKRTLEYKEMELMQWGEIDLANAIVFATRQRRETIFMPLNPVATERPVLNTPMVSKLMEKGYDVQFVPGKPGGGADAKAYLRISWA